MSETAGKPGFKLHSIIEKLSEQCGRSSPPSSHDGEYEDNLEDDPEQSTEPASSSGVEAPQDDSEVVNIETVEINPVVVHVNGQEVCRKRGRPLGKTPKAKYNVKHPKKSVTNMRKDKIWVKNQTSTTAKQRHIKYKEKARKTKAKVMPRKTASTQTLAGNICIDVNALMAVHTVASQSTPAKSKTISPPKIISSKNSCQRVDEDLCIDVNALIATDPQVQDIDVVGVDTPSPPAAQMEQGSCRLCFASVDGLEDFLRHFTLSHSECIKKKSNPKPTPKKQRGADKQVEEEEDEDWEEPDEEMEESDSDASIAVPEPKDPDFEAVVEEALGDDDEELLEAAVVPLSKRRRRSTRLRARQRVTLQEDPSEPEDNESDVEADVDVVGNSDGDFEEEEVVSTEPNKEKNPAAKPKKPKTIPCKSCDSMFYWQAELRFHTENKHPESVKPDNPENKKYFCDHCNKTFFWKKALMLHIRNVVDKLDGVRRKEKSDEDLSGDDYEPPPPPVFKCKECKKAFRSNSNMRKHMACTHSDERPFKCEICGLAFKDKGYVRRHMIVHTGEKKYKCDHCEKMFAHKGSLRSHTMIHTGERPHKCQFCDMGFISNFDLRVHENRHTGNFPYKCTQCGKAFPKSYGLKIHIKTHSTEKPHICEVCGKGFKRIDHLRLHRIIHSDIKPFKCDTCGRTFNQNICLRKHLPCREFERRQQREMAANRPKQPKPRKHSTSEEVQTQDKPEAPKEKSDKGKRKKTSEKGKGKDKDGTPKSKEGTRKKTKKRSSSSAKGVVDNETTPSMDDVTVDNESRPSVVVDRMDSESYNGRSTRESALMARADLVDNEASSPPENHGTSQPGTEIPSQSDQGTRGTSRDSSRDIQGKRAMGASSDPGLHRTGVPVSRPEHLTNNGRGVSSRNDPEAIPPLFHDPRDSGPPSITAIYRQGLGAAGLMGASHTSPLNTPPLVDMRMSQGEPSPGASLTSINNRISSASVLSMRPPRLTNSYSHIGMPASSLGPLSAGPYPTNSRMYQQSRYPDPCMYSTSGPQPFVPYNCGPDGSGVYHSGEAGLAMDAMHHGHGNHGNSGHIVIDRPYPHETSAELSNALFSAMDPDHLNNMVDHSSMFFPNT